MSGRMQRDLDTIEVDRLAVLELVLGFLVVEFEVDARIDFRLGVDIHLDLVRVSVTVREVERVVLVSGKLYWELKAKREKDNDQKMALVRLEQLYPLDEAAITAVLDRFPADAEIVWAQEEPENQGAWPFMALHLPELLGGREVKVISRAASAATSTGLKHFHEAQQKELVDRIFSR